MALFPGIFLSFSSSARQPAKGDRKPPFLLLIHSKREGEESKKKGRKKKRKRPEQKSAAARREAFTVAKNKAKCQLTKDAVEC